MKEKVVHFPAPSGIGLEHLLARTLSRVVDDGTSNMLEGNRADLDTRSQIQARLVAEQLFRRLERRYEKKLADALEAERQNAERKVAQIREENRLEEDQRRKQLERKRTELEEAFKERERSLIHSFEIKATDQENRHDLQRKLLENRTTELRLAAERLERANADFKRKIETDMDALRIEWERLALKEQKLKSEISSSEEIARIRSLAVQSEERVENFSKECTQLKTTVADLNRQCELQKIELDNAKLYKMSTESQLNRSKQVDSENMRLRNDVLELKDKLLFAERSKSNRLSSTAIAEVDALRYKVKEFQQALLIANGKIKSLSSERDYLRREIKSMRKNIIHQHIPITSNHEKNRRDSRASFVSSSSSDITSSDDLDISAVKRRLRHLNNVAQRLDDSVDLYTSTMQAKTGLTELPTSFRSGVELGLDDFCRRKSKQEHEHKEHSPIRYHEYSVDQFLPIEETRPVFKEEPKSTISKIPLAPHELPKKKSDTKWSMSDRLTARNIQIRSQQIIANEPKETEPELYAKTQSLPYSNQGQPSTSNPLSAYLSLLQSSTDEVNVPMKIPSPRKEESNPIPKMDDLVLDDLPPSGDEIDW